MYAKTKEKKMGENFDMFDMKEKISLHVIKVLRARKNILSENSLTGRQVYLTGSAVIPKIFS